MTHGTRAPDAAAATKRQGGAAGCLVIVTLVLAVFLSFLAFFIAPASQRLTTPVLCASGESSVVTTSTSTNMDGESSMTSTMYCVDAQGRAHPQNSFLAWLALMIEAFVALLALFLLRALLGRRSAP